MAAADDFKGHMESPASRAVAVAPHNTNELGYVTRGLYIGVTGDVKITDVYDNDTVFKAVPAGMILPVRAKRVFASLTTATDIVALS